MTDIQKQIDAEIETVGQSNIQRLKDLCDRSFRQSEKRPAKAPAQSGGGSESESHTAQWATETFQLGEFPMISLGKIAQEKKPATPNQHPKKGSESQDTRKGINIQTGMCNAHPQIPVHRIENMDLYLTAYDNFLARWVPDLEFSYTDPGRIQGGLGPLANAIKLAFSDQYFTVRKAYLGVRNEIFKDLGLDPTGNDDVESWPESLQLLEKDDPEMGPDGFRDVVDEIFTKLEDRSLLDLNGHRGSGYFLIWRDREAGHLVALPTIGSFGHFLPEPGFQLVREMGWPYFRNTEIIGFQIGHLRKVTVENPDGDWEDWDLRGPIYLEVTEQSQRDDEAYLSCPYDDTMIQRLTIDGAFFPGIIYGQIE